jgi:glycosyltransferase involved in cell wall biosynthesis
MKFSVVIPAHNGARYLRFTLESALNQARRADEIILFDDGSTDQTRAIAKSPGWDGSIKYFYNDKPTGFVDSWNRAVRKATGDFVIILHQDDLLHPNYLAYVENALRLYPHVRHVYVACNYIDEWGNVIRVPPGPHSVEPILYPGKQYAKNYLNGMIKNQHIHRCPGVATAKDLLLNQCSYRKEAGHIADDDFFLRVGAYTDVVGISEPLASFRIHPRSTTSNENALTLKLAEDYIFQLRYNRGNKTLLESEDIAKLDKQAVKFINLLLFQSFLYKQKDWMKKCFELHHEIEETVPGVMNQNSPSWAMFLWGISSSDNEENHLATLYVKCLRALIGIRDSLIPTSKN